MHCFTEVYRLNRLSLYISNNMARISFVVKITIINMNKQWLTNKRTRDLSWRTIYIVETALY